MDAKETRRTTSGVVIIVIGPELKTVVVTEKSRSDPLPKFPGGGVELGETPEQAVKRELREETGLSIIEGSLKELGKTLNKKRGFTHFFSARVENFTSLVELGTDYEVPEVIDFEEIEEMYKLGRFLPHHYHFLKTFVESEKTL